MIVIEGAGSPAEINLKQNDIVNMGLAKMLDAPVLLVGDIDRGGVFAQLYGTIALLEKDERERIKGLIINKFRGDVEILRPGLSTLEQKTDIPVLGVVPCLNIDVDDEDSLAPLLGKRYHEKPLDGAGVRLPRISNFTDFAPLEAHALLGVRYVKRVDELGEPDALILPGTKSTVDDLLWLRQNGLEAAIKKLAAKGVTVLGICGGYQMLGRTLSDPGMTEGNAPRTVNGMDLLPADTVFCGGKTLTRVHGIALPHPFSGAEIDAYEIHAGRTNAQGEPFCLLDGNKNDGCVCGSVYGTYMHGLFDTGELTEALAKALCAKRGIDYNAAAPVSRAEYLNRQYNLLADGVRKSLDMDSVYRILNKTE